MHKMTVILALLSLIGFVNLTSAQQSRPQSEITLPDAQGKPGTIPELRYDVQESNKQIDVLWRVQTLTVRIRLFNDSSKDIVVPLWGRGEFNDLFRFEIVGPDGKALIGPIPERLPEPIPAGLLPPPQVPRVNNSPFVLVKAKGMVESDINLGVTQHWYFHSPGQYTLTAEFVNTHSTYVDSQTHKVVKMDNAFIGSVKAPAIQVRMSVFANTQFGIRASIQSGIQVGGLTIAGQTLDEQGKPLAGTILELTRTRDPWPHTSFDSGGTMPISRIDRQKSDSEGNFKFVDLPVDANSYIIKAMHNGNYLMSMMILSNEKKTSRTNVKITMKGGKTLRGKVVDANGYPLAGVRVAGYGLTGNADQEYLIFVVVTNFDRLDAYAYTGENGEFEIQGLESEQCRFSCEGFKSRGAAPKTGHENDGTWTVVLEPEAKKPAVNTKIEFHYED
jgi:hypothetical protein